MEPQTVVTMNNFIFIIAVLIIAVIVSKYGVHKKRPHYRYYFIYYVEEEKGTDIKLPCNDLIDIHPLEWQTKHAIYVQGENGGYATVKSFRRTLVMWVELTKEEYDRFNEPIDSLWSSY